MYQRDGQKYLLFIIENTVYRLRFGSDGWFGYVISLISEDDVIKEVFSINRQENIMLTEMANSTLEKFDSNFKDSKLRKLNNYLKTI